jgi:pyruvate dehydrogenase E2 component (dihydrolipoamide acetyltransferase)
MVESLANMAQLTMVRQIDATNLRLARDSSRANPGLEQITYNDLLMFAVARVLPQHPALNATLEDATVTEWESVNLGLAVSLDPGLIVPVVRDCQDKSLEAISGESRQLVANAIAGRLGIRDVLDGTFTISNLGAFGIDHFTPIVNPPQVAILGVGRIRDTLSLSLTIDHRAVDGVPGARFLESLAHALEASAIAPC